MCRASGFFMLGSIFVLSKNKTLFLGFCWSRTQERTRIFRSNVLGKWMKYVHLSEDHTSEVKGWEGFIFRRTPSRKWFRGLTRWPKNTTRGSACRSLVLLSPSPARDSNPFSIIMLLKGTYSNNHRDHSNRGVERIDPCSSVCFGGQPHNIGWS